MENVPVNVDNDSILFPLKPNSSKSSDSIEKILKNTIKIEIIHDNKFNKEEILIQSGDSSTKSDETESPNKSIIKKRSVHNTDLKKYSDKNKFGNNFKDQHKKVNSLDNPLYISPRSSTDNLGGFISPTRQHTRLNSISGPSEKSSPTKQIDKEKDKDEISESSNPELSSKTKSPRSPKSPSRSPKSPRKSHSLRRHSLTNTLQPNFITHHQYPMIRYDISDNIKYEMFQLTYIDNNIYCTSIEYISSYSFSLVSHGYIGKVALNISEYELFKDRQYILYSKKWTDKNEMNRYPIYIICKVSITLEDLAKIYFTLRDHVNSLLKQSIL